MTYYKYYLLATMAGIAMLIAAYGTAHDDNETLFWKWFTANSKRLYEQKEKQKIFDELTIQLHKVDSHLVFSFRPISSDGIRGFTVSADGLKEYFPIVQSLVGKAPHIDKWKINAFRQRIPGNDMSINYGDKVKIGYSDLFFRYVEDSGKIALELNVRNFIDDPGLKSAVYILLDGLIGEYDMGTQISEIGFVPLNKNNTPGLQTIVELRDIVDENKRINKQ